MMDGIDPDFSDTLWHYAIGAVLAISLAFLLAWWRQLRRQWLVWRWERKIARNPYVLPEDELDHRWALDALDDAEQVAADRSPLSEALSGLLLMAACGLVSAVIADAFHLRWTRVFQGSLFVSAAAWSLWHWLNKPPPREIAADVREPGAGSIIVPQDAIMGGLAAAVTVGLILLLVWVM